MAGKSLDFGGRFLMIGLLLAGVPRCAKTTHPEGAALPRAVPMAASRGQGSSDAGRIDAAESQEERCARIQREANEVLKTPDVPVPTKGPVIREEVRVQLGNEEETWRLEWSEPPSPTCGPDETAGQGWNPYCEGFFYAETGKLSLVRSRGGKEAERLALRRFFPPGYAPAVLRRWDELEQDYEEIECLGPQRFADLLRRKPSAKVMRLADYNHDGWESEFMLHIRTMHAAEWNILLGVSRQNPHLHAFGTVRHPRKPLELLPEHWAQLLTAKGPITVLTMACGENVDSIETDDPRRFFTELEISVVSKGFRVVERYFECPHPDADPDAGGRLLKQGER